MPTRKTIDKINLDSTQSILIRMAARAINLTRKNNGHVNISMAIARMKLDCKLPFDEASEYITRVISDAEDLEWKG